jgi:hypothetical protein
MLPAGPTARCYYYSGFSTSSFSTVGWYWACGPEIGDVFYNVNNLNSSQIAATDSANIALGYYFNWCRGIEPNNAAAGAENCLTTLSVGGNGYQGTNFNWNNVAYTETNQSNDYAPKGYFVEYGDKELGDNGSGSAAFASDSGTLDGYYTATVNVKLDGSASSSPVTGDVELWQSGAKVYAMTGGSAHIQLRR